MGFKTVMVVYELDVGNLTDQFLSHGYALPYVAHDMHFTPMFIFL